MDDNTNVTSVNIDLDLLIEIRKLIEVSNSRINWKIEELLPVGIIINKLDKLLEKEKENK